MSAFVAMPPVLARSGAGPLPWLTDVLDAVATKRITIDEIHRLTPWAWATERRADLERAA